MTSDAALKERPVATRERSASASSARPGVGIAEGAHLRVDRASKRYGGRIVLHDVSVELRPGEAIGLLGPNGAGKTTTFYIVMGLIAADRGRVLLDGNDVTRVPMHRRARLGLGYLPQEASIFRGLSVAENVLAVLELHEPNRSARRDRLYALLAEFGLTHLEHAAALSLSGGERRRVEIARALASQPRYVLLDEPLAGIDPINVAEIRDLVSHLRERGIGVLITDHNVRDTLEIIDRAYILHDGRVLKEGPPADIVADPMVRQVYLGDRFTL